MSTHLSPLHRPAAAYSLAIVAAFAGIYFIWGTTYLGIALAIKTVPPFISGGVRFVIAGALMYAWLRLRGPSPFAGLDLRLAVLCGVLLSGIGNGYVGWSQQGIPSGIAALMVAAVPVIVLVLDWVFFSKRTPTRQALVGTAIAIAGVATIVMHTRSFSGNAQPIYLLAMLAATVGWSMGTLLQKRSARAETVLSFTCVQMLAGGVFQLLMSVFDGEWQRFDVSKVTATSALAILYLVVFGSIVALNCYLWLLTRVPAQKVTTYALVNPVVALLLGAWFLDERLTFGSIAAAVLVLVGVALVLFQDISLPRVLKTLVPDKSRIVRSRQ
jgi:drug/metabolite transporter (DMT)-like permease